MKEKKGNKQMCMHLFMCAKTPEKGSTNQMSLCGCIWMNIAEKGKNGNGIVRIRGD